MCVQCSSMQFNAIKSSSLQFNAVHNSVQFSSDGNAPCSMSSHDQSGEIDEPSVREVSLFSSVLPALADHSESEFQMISFPSLCVVCATQHLFVYLCPAISVVPLPSGACTLQSGAALRPETSAESAVHCGLSGL